MRYDSNRLREEENERDSRVRGDMIDKTRTLERWTGGKSGGGKLRREEERERKDGNR